MKRPLEFKLSIIILNFNTCDLLKQCLNSLLQKEDYQIIVVDNASTDDSVAMIKKEFPKVTLIQSETNCGYTRGNNLAKDKAKGETILFLNSDTKVLAGAIEKMLAYIESNSDMGVVTCEVVLPNGKLYYASRRGFPNPWNSFCYFSGLSQMFPKSKIFSGYTLSYLSLNTIHEIDACSGTFLMIRKNVLDKIGWFDEDYFSYGEDIEMCYRVKELGYKVVYNPEAKIIHYWGASSGLKSTSRDVTTASIENKEKWNRARYGAMRIFYDKHYRKKYPEFVRWLVVLGTKILLYLRENKD